MADFVDCQLTVVAVFRLFLIVVLAVTTSKGDCNLPESWKGSWFQSGIPGLLEINATHIQSKGECYEIEAHDKYVLLDRAEGCFRCLVIHEKHESILQYKESEVHCTSSRVSELCDMISGDAQLYSMFRKIPQSRAQPCPFRQAPFTFTYNRGTGECSFPPSRAESCTDDSRLLFRYQACPDVSGTESSIEELTCLGTWKEGSTKYLVGQITQLNRRNQLLSDEDSFRCFIYRGNHATNNVTTYHIAQSGDATCAGLNSPSDGSRTIKLTTGDDHHKRCHFPAWITEHHRWESLDRSKTYHFTQRNASLKIMSDEEVRVVCHSILMHSQDTRKLQIVAHITKGCESGHICMSFQRREGDVLEIKQSSRSYDDPEMACSDQLTLQETLISASPKPSRCPMFGRYSLSGQQHVRRRRQQNSKGQLTSEKTPVGDEIKECTDNTYDSLQIGCSGSQSNMEFKSPCISTVFTCHGAWMDNELGYAVITPTVRSSGHPWAYCFVYTQPNNVTGSWSVSLLESSCQRGQHIITTSYELTLNGTCTESSKYNSGGSATRLSWWLATCIPASALVLYNRR